MILRILRAALALCLLGHAAHAQGLMNLQPVGRNSTNYLSVAVDTAAGTVPYATSSTPYTLASGSLNQNVSFTVPAGLTGWGHQGAGGINNGQSIYFVGQTNANIKFQCAVVSYTGTTLTCQISALGTLGLQNAWNLYNLPFAWQQTSATVIRVNSSPIDWDLRPLIGSYQVCNGCVGVQWNNTIMNTYGAAFNVPLISGFAASSYISSFCNNTLQGDYATQEITALSTTPMLNVCNNLITGWPGDVFDPAGFPVHPLAATAYALNECIHVDSAPHKLFCATTAGTTTAQTGQQVRFVQASNPGAGCTNGTGVTVTGTTGTGTVFSTTGTVVGGSLVSVVTPPTTPGAYTVNPTTLTNEPVTVAGCTTAPSVYLIMQNVEPAAYAAAACGGTVTDGTAVFTASCAKRTVTNNYVTVSAGSPNHPDFFQTLNANSFSSGPDFDISYNFAKAVGYVPPGAISPNAPVGLNDPNYPYQATSNTPLTITGNGQQITMNVVPNPPAIGACNAPSQGVGTACNPAGVNVPVWTVCGQSSAGSTQGCKIALVNANNPSQVINIALNTYTFYPTNPQVITATVYNVPAAYGTISNWLLYNAPAMQGPFLGGTSVNLGVDFSIHDNVIMSGWDDIDSSWVGLSATISGSAHYSNNFLGNPNTTTQTLGTSQYTGINLTANGLTDVFLGGSRQFTINQNVTASNFTVPASYPTTISFVTAPGIDATQFVNLAPSLTLYTNYGGSGNTFQSAMTGQVLSYSGTLTSPGVVQFQVNSGTGPTGGSFRYLVQKDSSTASGGVGAGLTRYPY